MHGHVRDQYSKAVHSQRKHQPSSLVECGLSSKSTRWNTSQKKTSLQCRILRNKLSLRDSKYGTAGWWFLLLLKKVGSYQRIFWLESLFIQKFL